MDQKRPANSEVSLNSELLLFAPPSTNSGIQQTRWVDASANLLTSDGDVELSVSGSGNSYLDLAKSYLYVKAKIVKPDGTNVADDEQVAAVNFLLHTLFSQIDVLLQQKQISSTGNNYPYKAIIDAYLNYGKDAKLSHLQSALYFKDTPGELDSIEPKAADALSTPANNGLGARWQLTKGGKTVDLMGVPLLDMFQLDRYILDGVAVKLRMVQSKNSFRLMAKTNLHYRVTLLDVTLRVCKIYVDPAVIEAHSLSLMKNPAIYPYMASEIKTFAIAQGTYTIKLDDIFQGKVPSTLVCGMVMAEAYAGSYKHSPFNFKHCDIESFICYADNQAVPFNGINTNFAQNNYQEAYINIFAGSKMGLSDKGTDITRDDFKDGYALFVFNLDVHSTTPGVLPSLRSGNLALECRMSKALPWAATLICYGKFPSQFQIDKARAIII